MKTNHSAEPGRANGKAPSQARIVVATTVMLSFISFWRAAAIVLNDLASSAYYVGGIAEQAVGRAAPWFILGIMLFSYAVRAVYMESCSMFTRGGVYRVVKEAMGGVLAKLSVSALMFDYILTGPISGVSAGQYIVGLVATTMTYFGRPWDPSKDTINQMAAVIALFVTIYFWWRNTRGIHESSDDALKIMKITTVMVVMIIVWCGLTLITRGPAQLPPAPMPQNLHFNHDALGWLPQLAPHLLHPVPPEFPPAAGEVAPDQRFKLPDNPGPLIGLIGILIAFGHSMLAMSGEESLAQVNRELEHPKHKNLMRAGLVIFIYSLLFTSLVSFFASMIIPDAVRPKYYDNLISGLTWFLVGPETLRLLFQSFVVFVGFLILSGAVNTAIVGANGVLNRMSEDGVVTEWFRAPHPRFGTSFRIINLIVILQLATIALSRGDVYVLGEAYAFGVIWSFVFNSLAMVVLRYHDRTPRQWRVPLNLKFGSVEIPVGLMIVLASLLAVAGMNLVTKRIATISGLAFTAVLFVVFTVSEHINARSKSNQAGNLDQFRLHYEEEVSLQSVHVRPGNILVTVRDYTSLTPLEPVLARTDTEKRDIVVMTVRLVSGRRDQSMDQDAVFTEFEQRLFTRVVALAEKHGKHVELTVVPAKNVFDAVAQTAALLDTSEIVAGLSTVLNPNEQALMMGQAWERLRKPPDRQIGFTIVEPSGRELMYYLGAHAPKLTPDDVEFIHGIWLQLTRNPRYQGLHHRDVVRLALDRLNNSVKEDQEIPEIEQYLKDRSDTPPALSFSAEVSLKPLRKKRP